MNIFVLFGALLWMAILAVLSLCLIALLIAAGIKKSWKFALKPIVGIAGAIVVVTGLFGLLGYLWFRPYDPTSEQELRDAYRADFGVMPPAGITVLKARQVVIADSGAQWLLLKATPEEIDRHVAMGFAKTQYPSLDFRGRENGNAPKWWQPPTGRLEFYESTNWSKTGGWSWSSAAIGADKGSNLIWFVTSKAD